jgi:PrtD family type I secretion system ABC transporter
MFQLFSARDRRLSFPTWLKRTEPNKVASTFPISDRIIRAKHRDLNADIASNPAVASALAGFRQPLLMAGLLTLVINLLMLASPLFMLQVYDRVLVSRSLPTLLVLVGLVAGAFIAAAVLEVIRSRLLTRVGAGFSLALAPRLFKATVDHSLAGQPAATQAARDLDQVRAYLAGAAVPILFDLPWVPIYMGISYLLHPLLGLLTLVSGILLAVIALLSEWLTARIGARASLHSQASHTLLEEARHGSEVLRAIGIERHFQARWEGLLGNALSGQIAASDRGGLLASGARMLRLFLQSASLALGAGLAITGQVSAGTIIAASIVMSRALAPIEQATVQWGSLQAVRRAYQRLRACIDGAARDVKPLRLPDPRGKIEFKNVAVKAPGASVPSITGLTFTLNPGECLGVVGPTGSGKSTLMRALAGVWPVLNGDVRLDGASIEQWPRRQFASAIGYLPQDVELLSGTIRDNISRFDPSADDASIVDAAKRANVHEMILHLPKGYQTPLGEHGARLSGGERQRIGLARALYGNPVLLILDEPNANLDSTGELALQQSLAAHSKKGRSVVIVSHRASVLGHVDYILLLQDGKAPLWGPRDEMLARLAPGGDSGARTSMSSRKQPFRHLGNYMPAVAGEEGACQ